MFQFTVTNDYLNKITKPSYLEQTILYFNNFSDCAMCRLCEIVEIDAVTFFIIVHLRANNYSQCQGYYYLIRIHSFTLDIDQTVS